MTRLCPNCGKDITDYQFESDSVEVKGFIDIGYDCADCEITVYTFKVIRLKENIGEVIDNGIK